MGASASQGSIGTLPKHEAQERDPVQAAPEPEGIGDVGGPSDGAGAPEGAERAAPLAPPEQPVTHPFHEPLPVPGLSAEAPAMRNANLSPAACRAEVRRRKLAFKRDRRPTPGVATALRFTAPLDGVRFLSAGDKSRFGVMDCRLALTFADLASVLRKHSVAAVSMGTIYRVKSRLPSRKPSQHSYGLAADIVGFKLDDGRTLVFESDWQGEVGTPPCGSESVLKENTDEAIALRNLVCDIARGGFFHHMLTPSYNQAHHDHLHVDIKRDARRWMIK